MGHIPEQEVNCGETVSAILRSALTGEKRVIDRNTPKSPRYEIEIKVTDLRTGENILDIKETR